MYVPLWIIVVVAIVVIYRECELHREIRKLKSLL